MFPSGIPHYASNDTSSSGKLRLCAPQSKRIATVEKSPLRSLCPCRGFCSQQLRWKTALPCRNVVSVKRLIFSTALLLAPIVCAGQESTPKRDCATHGFFLHKTPCLCGEVSITSGDISLSPEVFGLDDFLDVELRDKAGNVLSRSVLSYRKDRTFCFLGRQKGVYALAFICTSQVRHSPPLCIPLSTQPRAAGRAMSYMQCRPIVRNRFRFVYRCGLLLRGGFECYGLISSVDAGRTAEKRPLTRPRSAAKV
jgi:hypothetical protein